MTARRGPVRDDLSRLLFADDGDRGRHRRLLDGFLVVAAGLLLLTASVVSAIAKSGDLGTVHAARSLLAWFDAGWRAAYTAAIAYGLLVLVATLVTHRWRLARDLSVAVIGVAVIGLPAGRAARAHWPTLAEGLWKASDQYPALRLAAAVAVLTVAGPELTRTARLVAIWLVAFGSVGAVVLGVAYPSAVLGGVALGLAAAGVVRLVFGSSMGFPSQARVLAGLAELGIATNAATVALRQRPGAATYTTVDEHGTDLQVVVLGRDAQDTQRLVNSWRNLAYRYTGPNLAPGRLQQIEHESLITLLAEQAGVVVGRVRVAGLVDSGDALLVTEQPSVAAIEESATDLSDELLAEIWRNAAALRTARLAHGALNLSNVLATDAGPMIVRFNHGQLAATESALDIDVAELLAATSIAAGPERALGAALKSVGATAVVAALPFLQRAALTPHLRDLARNHELKLSRVRSQAAAATHVKLPQIAPMRRVRLRDVAIMVLVAVAAYLIISQLEKIGFATIGAELRLAQWPWVATALVLAQLTFATQAVALRGAVLTPLPFAPCVALQAAIKFINLTVPSSAGRIAINIRFLQHLGAPTGEAVASSAVDGLAETLTQVLLVLLIIPFVHLNIKLSAPSANASTVWLILAILVAAVVVIAVVLGNPKWRAKLMPTAHSAFASLVAVARTRSKRVQLFGGNVATQVLFALTLDAACHAYGVRLALPALLLVNMGASVFANLVAVPGGIGVAEAGLTAGLVALGVNHSVAFAAALTHRLCTYYLPPVWGYFALRWLNRKAYL